MSTTLEDLFRPYGIPPSPLHEVVQEAARRAGWTPPWDCEEQRRQKKLAGEQSGIRRAGLAQIRQSVVKVARMRLKSKHQPYSDASVAALIEEFRRLVADGGKNCASLAKDKRDLCLLVPLMLGSLSEADRQKLEKTSRDTVLKDLKQVLKQLR
jgi:hypothetical protein